jgi:hypothetical protein
LQQEVLIVMARRRGKTYSVAMIAAAILLCVGSCNLAIFSTGDRMSRALMDVVRFFVEKAFALGSVPAQQYKLVLDNKDTLSFIGPDGSKRTIMALPGTAKVSILFCCGHTGLASRLRMRGCALEMQIDIKFVYYHQAIAMSRQNVLGASANGIMTAGQYVALSVGVALFLVAIMIVAIVVPIRTNRAHYPLPPTLPPTTTGPPTPLTSVPPTTPAPTATPVPLTLTCPPPAVVPIGSPLTVPLVLACSCGGTGCPPRH